MTGKPIVVLERLSKTFGTGWPWRKVTALWGIDITINEGEIVGYLGPNGAGKTTTLKLMMGLLKPTRGRVMIGARPPSDPRARRMIGFLPENPYFYEYLTGEEFLLLCARLGNGHGRISKAFIASLLEKVGLQEAAARPLRKYSKGMLQRIGLAQALVNDPPVLILDEPMSGLDPIGRREVRDLILALKDRGKTIFFSSHILADVELICDRVAFLHQGRLLGVRSLESLPLRKDGIVEVKVTGLDSAILNELKGIVKKIIQGTEATALVLDSTEQLPAVLDAVRKGGGILISVNPRRESLEDLFLKLVAEGTE